MRHIFHRAPSLALAIAAVLVAVGAARGVLPHSGLYGFVLRGPTKPICEIGTPCEAAAPDVTLVFSSAGRLVAHVTSGAGGAYRIALVPGTYTVRSTRKYYGHDVSPILVTVRVGHLVRVIFHIETGIR